MSLRSYVSKDMMTVQHHSVVILGTIWPLHGFIFRPKNFLAWIGMYRQWGRVRLELFKAALHHMGLSKVLRTFIRSSLCILWPVELYHPKESIICFIYCELTTPGFAFSSNLRCLLHDKIIFHFSFPFRTLKSC